MKYQEFKSRREFSKEELLAFAYGRLVKDPPENFLARLPTPPMLMVDRVSEISARGNRGRIVAERDVHLDDWFFQCHFQGDPVQPGCLGLDGVWQMLGFYCNWRGGLGAGRALGCKEVDFSGQIRPHDTVVTYDIEVRLPNSEQDWKFMSPTTMKSFSVASLSSIHSMMAANSSPRRARLPGPLPWLRCTDIRTKSVVPDWSWNANAYGTRS